MNISDLDIPHVLENIESPLLTTLVERGFVKNCTDLKALDRYALDHPVSAYVGFDLTAPALHVGSMIPLMAMRHIRAAGVALGMSKNGGAVDLTNIVLGDATTRVGDPTGKDAARPVIDEFTIEENRIGIVRSIDRTLGPARHLHNSRWLDKLTFMDFLTGPARQISLNRMMSTDVVGRRIESGQPMTLMELVYQAMQGMDFAHLANHAGIRLQIGGSDQWTNILSGVDLAKRLHGIETFGLTMPLLVDASGRKIGKTSGGAVWLDPKLTKPFDFWQFWRNTPDEKVGEFLGLFTDLPMEEVREHAALTGSAINEAKILLANEVTGLVHGEEVAADASLAAAAAHRTSSLPPADDAGALAHIPTTACPVDPSQHPVTPVLLAVHAGLCETNGEAKRLIAGGGLKIDNTVVDDPRMLIGADAFATGSIILTAGKKRHVRITAAETA